MFSSQCYAIIVVTNCWICYIYIAISYVIVFACYCSKLLLILLDYLLSRIVEVVSLSCNVQNLIFDNLKEKDGRLTHGPNPFEGIYYFHWGKSCISIWSLTFRNHVTLEYMKWRILRKIQARGTKWISNWNINSWGLVEWV